MSTLQEQQAPIDRLIVNALISATPDWWSSAVIEIERIEEPGGIETLRQVIISPEMHNDLVSSTPELHEAIIALADLFRGMGVVWSKAVYQIELLPDGNWKYSGRFEY